MSALPDKPNSQFRPGWHVNVTVYVDSITTADVSGNFDVTVSGVSYYNEDVSVPASSENFMSFILEFDIPEVNIIH